MGWYGSIIGPNSMRSFTLDVDINLYPSRWSDISGNVGLQNCYMILDYSVDKTNSSASNTWNDGNYLYGSTVENDLKLPMGDVSGHIITNPLFMVGRNSLYGGIGEDNSYELKSTKFGPQKNLIKIMGYVWNS